MLILFEPQLWVVWCPCSIALRTNVFLLLWKLGLKKIIENFRTEINDIIRKKKTTPGVGWIETRRVSSHAGFLCWLMKCQLSICTVLFLCGSFDMLFSMGKTLAAQGDMSYAVINAIMKMKIAVVGTIKPQWKACELRRRKSHCQATALRDCSPSRLAPSDSVVDLSVSNKSAPLALPFPVFQHR